MIRLTKKIIFQRLFLIALIMFTIGAHAHQKTPKEFVHGITIKLGHDLYNLAGPPDGQFLPDGVTRATDVPGHSWIQLGKHRLLGKHVNTGAFSAPSFWSSDAGDGELLFAMEAIIDNWSEAKSLQYFMKGFHHYHTLVNIGTGQLHPNRVVWFKHVAVKDFTLDGLAARGVEPYDVKKGVDFRLGSNWDMPYDPNPITTQ